jgi:hypothetical protein
MAEPHQVDETDKLLCDILLDQSCQIVQTFRMRHSLMQGFPLLLFLCAAGDCKNVSNEVDGIWEECKFSFDVVMYH